VLAGIGLVDTSHTLVTPLRVDIANFALLPLHCFSRLFIDLQSFAYLAIPDCVDAASRTLCLGIATAYPLGLF
jgi:hypothetical protein